MLKRILLAAPASLALIAAAPLAAQDEDAEAVWIDEEEGEMPSDPMAAVSAMFGELFKVEPLTAEQEARMPTAQRLSEKMMPDGTLAEVFSTMINDLMGPLMDMAPPPTKQIVNRNLGLYGLELSDEEMAEIAGMIDPVWEEREKREREAIPEVMSKVMTAIEPGVRKGVAELFAIKFNESELGDLEAFFSTEVGTKFARESYRMATDKRMISSTIEALPAVMGMMSDLKNVAEQATADLPPKREFSELSAKEKARIAELTGYSVEEIEELSAAYTSEYAAYAEDDAMEAAAEEATEEAADAVEEAAEE